MKKRPVGIIERLNKCFTRPLAHRLVGILWITPNRITWTSAAFAGLLAPLAIVEDWHIAAALLVLAGAWLDSLDGDLAQARGCGSKEGEILDAVLDRYIDFALVVALIYREPDYLMAGLAALLGCQMVPYIRARTEAAGKSSIATFGSRDIRNFILVLGLITGLYKVLIIVLAVVTNLSAIHRFVSAISPKKSDE